MPFKAKTEIKENGRVCTVCGEFKLWNEFARTIKTITKRTPNCKVCRNKYKKQYRIKTGYKKDREYKKNKRELKIGDIIAFYEPIYVDGFPREDSREVIRYEYKKGYLLQSIHTKQYCNLDTNDNQKVNKNSKNFYKITNK